MKVGEYIKELEKYNTDLPLFKSIPMLDDCAFQKPIEPKIVMVDDWHYKETKRGTILSYTYEKKPILVI